MDEYAKTILGMRHTLAYLEKFAETDASAVSEVERTRQLITAAECGDATELRELLARPMPDHYGGTGWQHVVALSKSLLETLENRK